MTNVCFFNQQMSDCLQHIALFFEVSAVYLVWQDHRIRESDLSKKSRAAMAGMNVPHAKRTKGLIFALVIGAIAVCMEIYQLASQYLGC